MKKYCAGIDVDKNTFKVCLLSLPDPSAKKVLGSRTFSNSIKGFEGLLEWSNKKLGGATASFVMEATGVYHEHLAHYLHERGKPVHIVLASKSKHYLQSLGFRSKTDKLDAKGLAMMGIEQQLDVWQPGSKQLLKLRSLTRQIEMLQDHRTAFSNQLEAAKHSAVMHMSVVRSIEKMIKEVGAQTTKLEKEVADLVASDEYLKKKFELFSSLRGVGIMTFAVVVSETNGFALFENQRQLVCYAGYDVLKNESGKRIGKTRISKKGNTHIRRILHMAAWCVVRNKSGTFPGLYHRVFDRTGIKMKGYVAVQRKLLTILYALWKKDEAFDPTYRSPGNKEHIIKTASTDIKAALDGQPRDQSLEALFR